MKYLPLANTILIAAFVLFLGCKFNTAVDSVIAYTYSAKEVNDALTKQVNSFGDSFNSRMDAQFKEIKNSVFDPIKNDIISPISESAKNVKELTSLLNKRSAALQKRANSNERIAHIALSQLKKANAVIYASEFEGNSEPADLWVYRAEVEVEVIKWIAWNEKDVLYRLGLKDISLNISLNTGPRKWMIKLYDEKEMELYKWFLENERINKELDKFKTGILKKT